MVMLVLVLMMMLVLACDRMQSVTPCIRLSGLMVANKLLGFAEGILFVVAWEPKHHYLRGGLAAKTPLLL